MGRIFKLVAALSVPLLLSGCFLLPGKFDAHLNILDGDRYEFSYVGQIQMAMPSNDEPEKPSDEPFDPAKMKCRDLVYKATGEVRAELPIYGDDYDPYASDSSSDSDREYNVVDRTCTVEEVAAENKHYDNEQKRKLERYKEETAMVGAFFGGPVPGDDDSMRAFAKTLKKYSGWKKVEYTGNNVFEVEYRASGIIGSYFSFPILPDAQMQYPFFQLIRRSDGAVELLTPGVDGQGSLFKMMMMDKNSGKAPGVADIDGTLTVETNGSVVSNNSTDGFTEKGDRKVMRWKIGKHTTSDEIPRALIRY